MRRPLAAATAALLLGGLAVAAPSSADTAPTITNACLDSVPEPKSAAPVKICYTLFQPAGATAAAPVPMVLHGHGWGGSRTRTASSFAEFLGNGYGVLSIDQRGFGESGGRAHTFQPDIEGQDILRIVDLVAGLPWVAKEPGTTDDPVLGAIGGSYGGGYQYLGAFTDLMQNGRNRFDALAPEITWHDLKEALAPQEVARGTWLSLLTAVSVQDNDERAQRAFAYGAATGLWPKGPAAQAIDADMDAYFEKTGPKWHIAQGRRLDVPVLARQGTSDTLFNLNEGIKNFDLALTPEARAKSLLIGYNGGHVLPTALPRGAATDGDPCSAKLGAKSFTALTRAFFDQHLKGRPATVPGVGQYHLATQDAKECITVGTVAPSTTVAKGTLPTTTAAGGPVHHELASGPLTVAGVPRVDAVVTSAGVHNKAFFGLSVGTNPADAVVVQHNVMPLHEPAPLVGTERSVELPGVSVVVPAGQKLFLTISPVSDMSASSGSRTPGALVLDRSRVQLPVVTQQAALAPPAVTAAAEVADRKVKAPKR
jgi:ABC-2 type transport system ATP-binding protein